MAMDSSCTQPHHQEILSQTLETMMIPTKAQPEKKPKPAEQALKCPRCDSTNTKFCYYNNYSLSQPRYFCKSCRRYWTKGGTLRNVPVGGGCRKTKKSSSSSSKKSHDQPITTNPSPIVSYNASPLSYDSNMFAPFGIDDPGFLMSQVGGFIEPPLGFQNLCGANLGMEINGGIGIGIGLNQEMGLLGFEEMSGAAAAAAVKQEADGEISRAIWGLQWQNVGGDGGNAGWNGIGSSNWNGLLNSPLM